MASVDDLWIVDFAETFPGEPAFHRPAVVLGPPGSFGASFPFTIVAPLTTTDRGLSLHVEVAATIETGLNESSYVQCELTRSINAKRLVHHLGIVSTDTSMEIERIVRTLLNH